jgi:hypothetical protein
MGNISRGERLFGLSDISHLYSNRGVIKTSKVKKVTPKKYAKKESSFLCLPILNYCIVIVNVRYAEKNSMIPNLYITQYRLRCRLNQIVFYPSISFSIISHDFYVRTSFLGKLLGAFAISSMKETSP